MCLNPVFIFGEGIGIGISIWNIVIRKIGTDTLSVRRKKEKI